MLVLESCMLLLSVLFLLPLKNIKKHFAIITQTRNGSARKGKRKKELCRRVGEKKKWNQTEA